MKIELLEIYGFVGMLKSLRLPFKKEVRSRVYPQDIFENPYGTGEISLQTTVEIQIDPKDIKLLQALIKAGDEHAKALRMLRIDCKLKTTRGLWQELDTYEVGVVNGCSESTMHTILNEELSLEHFDCHELNKGSIQRTINEINFIKGENATSKTEKTRLIKEILPESYLQERVISFSYQTLQRIYYQRCIVKHRLTQWENFGKFVESLPLSKELITGKYEFK
jgi:hypothetical protein